MKSSGCCYIENFREQNCEGIFVEEFWNLAIARPFAKQMILYLLF